MKVAREKGLPELKHHLLPRTKGFYLIANLVKGKSTSYLNTLLFIINKRLLTKIY